MLSVPLTDFLPPEQSKSLPRQLRAIVLTSDAGSAFHQSDSSSSDGASQDGSATAMPSHECEEQAQELCERFRFKGWCYKGATDEGCPYLHCTESHQIYKEEQRQKQLRAKEDQRQKDLQRSREKLQQNYNKSNQILNTATPSAPAPASSQFSKAPEAFKNPQVADNVKGPKGRQNYKPRPNTTAPNVAKPTKHGQDSKAGVHAGASKNGPITNNAEGSKSQPDHNVQTSSNAGKAPSKVPNCGSNGARAQQVKKADARASMPCWQFAKGNCTRQACPYLHDESVLNKGVEQNGKAANRQKIPYDLCRDFVRGKCSNKNCRWLHDEKFLPGSEKTADNTTHQRNVSESTLSTSNSVSSSALASTNSTVSTGVDTSTVLNGRPIKEWIKRCKNRPFPWWDRESASAFVARNIKGMLSQLQFIRPWMTPEQEEMLDLWERADMIASSADASGYLKSQMTSSQQKALDGLKIMFEIFDAKTPAGRELLDSMTIEEKAELKRQIHKCSQIITQPDSDDASKAMMPAEQTTTMKYGELIMMYRGLQKASPDYAQALRRYKQALAEVRQLSEPINIDPHVTVMIKQDPKYTTNYQQSLARAVKIMEDGPEGEFVLFGAFPPGLLTTLDLILFTSLTDITEIRQEIWKIALCSTPNTAMVRLQYSVMERKDPAMEWVNVLAPCYGSQPQLMQVNTESRAMALMHYERTWDTATGNALTYFRFETDTLWIHTRDPDEFPKIVPNIIPEQADRLQRLSMPFRDAFINESPEQWAIAVSTFRRLRRVHLVLSDDPIDRRFNSSKNRVYWERVIGGYLDRLFKKKYKRRGPTVVLNPLPALACLRMGYGVLRYD